MFRTILFALCTLCLAAQRGRVPQPPKATPPDPEKLCTLEGKVVHAITGEPLRKARLTVVSPGGESRGPQAATSDAEGKFRIVNVEPGRYLLSADRVGFVRSRYGGRTGSSAGTMLALEPGQSLTGMVVKLTPQGVILGSVLDEDGDPAPNVHVMVLRWRFQGGRRELTPAGGGQSNDIGEYRVANLSPGRYYLSATHRQGMFGETRGPRAAPALEEAYATVYYPGNLDPAGAAPIEVRAGAELRGMDIRLLKRRVVRVSGRIEGAGPRGRITISLLPQGAGSTVWTGGRAATSARPGGEFEIAGVIPGSYILMAQGGDRENSGYARQNIEVGESNLENVVVRFQPGMQVTGQFRFEGEQPVTRPPVRVTLLAAETGSMMARPAGGAGAIREDGTFTMSNVVGDRYRIEAYGLPAEAYIKSVRYGDQEAIETGIDLTTGAGGVIEVIASMNAGRIDGTVLTANQEPAGGATVTLVPEENRRRQTGRYKMTTTDQTGAFTIRGVPPGDYKLFAWEEIETMAWQDPEFIKPFEPKSKAVTVRERSRETVEVKVIPAEGERN